MHNTKMLKVNLQLFGEGGTSAGGAAATSGTASAQGTESAALPMADKSGSNRRTKSSEAKVVYGKQADVPLDTPAADGISEGNGVVTTSDSKEARRAKFKEMVEGEFKDEYSEMFQQAFNRRFKDVKEMENSLSAQKPILDILAQRYKIADGDMGKLLSAVEQDDQYWEEAAEEEGLTVEQYKAMQKLKRENEELNKMRKRQLGEQQAQAQISAWYKEAESMKNLYPSFDFNTEAKNRDFLGLLRKGLPVQQAYELVHMDEIKEATAKSAAQAAGAQMEARIKSKASRPSENGMSSQSAAVIKKDSVSSLTRKDRANIAKLVQRGEKISF
jgi:hypothetical protein